MVNFESYPKQNDKAYTTEVKRHALLTFRKCCQAKQTSPVLERLSLSGNTAAQNHLSNSGLHFYIYILQL